METAIHPSFVARQISGKDEQQRYILGVVAKRTYRIEATGRCIPIQETLPLIAEPTFYADNSDLLEHDCDLLPKKSYTDVVIKGRATVSRPLPQFLVEIQIGSYRTEVMILGNRRAYLNHSGILTFTEPEPIQTVPLRYDFAYGGRDVRAEAKIEMPPVDFMKLLPPKVDLLAGNLCRYARNPLGKGYLVELDRPTFEELELPNLEDPVERLTSQNLLVTDPEQWHYQPMPRATDWVGHDWFPRGAYLGLFPPAALGAKPITELLRGWVEADIMAEKSWQEKLSMRFLNGASLGLQLPYLQGKEKCRLVNIHPDLPDFSFQLPDDRPEIWVDGRKDGLKKTSPVIHTVAVEPAENRISIVWGGHAPALRPYMPEELETMPYEVRWP